LTADITRDERAMSRGRLPRQLMDGGKVGYPNLRVKIRRLSQPARREIIIDGRFRLD